MTKTYPIITINGEQYVVDRDKEPEEGNLMILGNVAQTNHRIEVANKELIFHYKEMWKIFKNARNPMPPNVICTVVLATTDKSLSLSLLPLKDERIPFMPKEEQNEGLDFPAQLWGWVRGYKAAKGKNMYSEEDIRKAIQRTFDITHNNALLIKEDCKRIEDDTLDSLKPILKAVELECEELIKYKVEMFTQSEVASEPLEISYKPKLTKDGYVIVKNYIWVTKE